MQQSVVRWLLHKKLLLVGRSKHLETNAERQDGNISLEILLLLPSRETHLISLLDEQPLCGLTVVLPLPNSPKIPVPLNPRQNKLTNPPLLLDKVGHSLAPKLVIAQSSPSLLRASLGKLVIKQQHPSTTSREPPE